MKRLAIISSHPIQYNAPLFRLLHERNLVDVRVFYTWSQSESGVVFDPGFGQSRSWDIPLLEGYPYEFVPNVAQQPGSHHFWGIQNPNLIERINSYKPDAVLVFGWSFRSHLAVMRYFKGKIPVWFRGDSTLLDEPSGWHAKTWLRRLALRMVMRYVDVAFYVGESNKRYFLAHGLRESQLIYAPHAVDNNRFGDPQGEYQAEADHWRQQLGLRADRPSFLFAGKLEAKKNVLALVEAFVGMPHVDLILVGNGVLEDNVRQLASRCTNVYLLPFQNQSKMPVVYRLANYFTLPSSGPGETWGLALNEAMACGRPVIASTKCGGALDLIQPGWNGFITSGRVADLQQIVQQCLSHNYTTLQRHASEHIRTFSLERIARQWEETL